MFTKNQKLQLFIFYYPRADVKPHQKTSAFSIVGYNSRFLALVSQCRCICFDKSDSSKDKSETKYSLGTKHNARVDVD